MTVKNETTSPPYAEENLWNAWGRLTSNPEFQMGTHERMPRRRPDEVLYDEATAQIVVFREKIETDLGGGRIHTRAEKVLYLVRK